MVAPVLRWRSADDTSSSWLELCPVPGENRGFAEKRSYVFEISDSTWSLRIDDEPLRPRIGHPSTWIWEPGFFAGEVTAALVRDEDDSEILFLLDVAPDPNKVGREIFGNMVEELWNEDPTLVIGAEPATTQIGDLGEAQDPWLAFARLRRYAPVFVRALDSVRANPRRALRARRDSASLHHVRRVDQQTAVAVLRNPALALLLTGREDAPSAALHTPLDVPVVDETLDAAANRAMLALLLALQRRTRMVGERLQQMVDRESLSETRTSLEARWPARRQFLDLLAAQLRTALRRAPFPHVRRAEVSASGLTAIAADPIYSRAWSRGWRALRHGVESAASVGSADSTDRLWISPSWEIYERWCFVRLGKLLAASFPDWGWIRLSNPRRWVGSAGDRHAELRLQPTFTSRRRDGNKMWSVSRERVPDLVLTVEDAGGVRFVVVDAKYRTARESVLDAMASAHIYQDSLRIGSRRAEASLLLVPSGGGAPWLEDADFQAEHRVGVHPFSANTDTALPVQIRRELEARTTQ